MNLRCCREESNQRITSLVDSIVTMGNNLDHLPSVRLDKLIERSKWVEIREHLESPSSKSIVQKKYDGDLTCLGLAICHNAPIDIIDSMIEIDVELVSSTDVYGLNVLHLGCLNGAPFNLIQYILQRHGGLIRKVDVDGRSPLHHAVEYSTYCAIEGRDDYFYYIEVVEELCSFAPDLAILYDRYHVTPLDLVQNVKMQTDPDTMEYERLDIIYEALVNASITNFKAIQKKLIEQRLSRTNIPTLQKLTVEQKKGVEEDVCTLSSCSDETTCPQQK